MEEITNIINTDNNLELFYEVTKLIRLTNCSIEDFEKIHNYLTNLSLKNNNVDKNSNPIISGNNYTKTIQEIKVEEFYNKIELNEKFNFNEVYKVIGNGKESNRMLMYYEDVF